MSFKPKSIPTASFGATECAVFLSTDTHSHQSPTASWAKQPDFRLAPSRSSRSKTRNALPEKRKDFPLHFNCAALKGIQPKERLAPWLTRQRSFARLNCFRRVANSAFTRWIVSEPIRLKHSVAPAVSLSRSNAVSHRGRPENGRAAL